MNTSAPTAVNRAERPARARAVALLAAAALLALAGCATHPKHAPPPPPVEVVQPKPPPKRPPPPVAPPTPPEVTPPPARNFSEEKARRQLELAADPENSVGAADVGYYLDVLLGRLKQGLGTEVGIARRGLHIVVVLPTNAGFPVGSAQLTPALRTRLAQLSVILLEYRRVLVSVYVHADASVIGASNPRLAQQRAELVAAYFGGAGIDPRRLLVAPPGPSRPAAGGQVRIEFDLEPILRPSPRARPRS